MTEDPDEPAALASIEFPTPRADSINSVIAAQAYLEANQQATKTEIIDALSPEEDHQIGLAAAQALGKLNDISAYRDWWWTHVVEPGLRALPEIEQGATNQWRHVEDPGTASPQDGPHLESLFATLNNPAAPVPDHATAAQQLFTAMATGTAAGSRFVEPLARLLSRPSLNADATLLRCLGQLATQHPADVMTKHERIIQCCSAGESKVIAAALECVSQLVSHDPQPFVDLAPILDSLLDHSNEEIRTNAIYIVSQLARERPNDMRPLLPGMLADIEENRTPTQRNALSAVGHIATEYPAAAQPAIPQLAELIRASDSVVRANAIGVLADIGKAHPEEISEYSDAIAEHLHDDDEYVRGNAVSAILHVGIADRDSVAATLPALIELLNDPSPVVRRNVCKALGTLEAGVAIEQLRERSTGDPNESVRIVATRAVDELTE